MSQKLFMFVIGFILVWIGLVGFSAGAHVNANSNTQPVALAAPKPVQAPARTTPTPAYSTVQPAPQPAPRPTEMVTTAVTSQNGSRIWASLLLIALLVGTVVILLAWMIRLNWQQAQHERTAAQSISVKGMAS